MTIKTQKGNWEKLVMRTPLGKKITVYSHGFYPLWVYAKWDEGELNLEISTFGIWEGRQGEVVPQRVGFIKDEVAFLDKIQEAYEEGGA